MLTGLVAADVSAPGAVLHSFMAAPMAKSSVAGKNGDVQGRCQVRGKMLGTTNTKLITVLKGCALSGATVAT